MRNTKNGRAAQQRSIDNETNPKIISQIFSMQYKKILDRKQKGIPDAKFRHLNINYRKYSYESIRISSKILLKAVASLKCSIGFDGIHSNHINKLCTNLYLLIVAMLFTCFLSHEYSPSELLRGIISPTIKDKFGNLNSSSNYRPVMTSSVFLKLFEYCILFKIKEFVKLNDRQHGFRESYSTATACFSLKETIFNYINSGSKVYASFLDLRKAFDSVNHEYLIDRLLDIGIPDLFISNIKYIYSNQLVKVRYDDFFSDEWLICNGVRQGGVLSGLLFNIYIDDVLNKITNLKIGCRLGISASNIIAYADDMVVLAPSPSSLQILINIIYTELLKLDLIINENNSKIMIFTSGKSIHFNVRQFFIGSKSLDKVDSFTYLGYEIEYNLSFNRDINRRRSKFYSEFNQVLRKFNGTNTSVKLLLFKQYCLQLYGAELWFGNRNAKGNFKQFSVGYHKAVKKLIGVSYHESNHYACQEAQILMFDHYVFSLKVNFLFRLYRHPCEFIRKNMHFLLISSVFFNEVNAFASVKYSIDSIFDNDEDAIFARICYIQNHETPLR